MSDPTRELLALQLHSSALVVRQAVEDPGLALGVLRKEEAIELHRVVAALLTAALAVERGHSFSLAGELKSHPLQPLGWWQDHVAELAALLAGGGA